MYFEGDAYDLLKTFGNKEVWFVEEATGLEFKANPIDILNASQELNKRFEIMGMASMEDFFDILGIDYSNTPRKRESYGWNFDCFEGWDAPWIEFIVRTRYLKGRLVFNLSCSIGPCSLYDECNGCYDSDGYFTCEKCLVDEDYWKPEIDLDEKEFRA